MRPLLFLSIGFALGTAAAVYLLSGTQYWLVCCLALLLGVFCLLLRRKKMQVAILAFACAASLLYVHVFSSLFLAPLQSADEQTVTVDGEVCEIGLFNETVTLRAHVEGRAAKVLLYRARGLSLGDKVRFSQKLYWANPKDSYGRYRISQGIDFTGTMPEDAEVTYAVKVPVRYYPAYFAGQIREKISAQTDGDVRGFLTALLTGDRSFLRDVLINQLSVTGIYHMVAISGMHTAILLEVIRILCGKRKKLTALLGVPVLIFFVLMTGASAGTVRAAIMLSVLLFAPLVKREYDAPTTLGLSAFLILLSNPYEIASYSFQMTFCATAGILLFSGRFQDMLLPETSKKRKSGLRKLPSAFLRGIVGILSITLSAQVTTLPLSLFYFGQLCLISPLTNLLTSSVVSIVFALGFPAVAFLFLWNPLGSILLRGMSFLIQYVLFVVRTLYALPFASLYTESPYTAFFAVFLYAVLVVILLAKTKPRPVIPTCCIVFVLCICLMLNLLSARFCKFSATVFDVGEGECIFVSCGEQCALLDCGGSDQTEVLKKVTRRLATLGKKNLEILILSHYDADHCGAVLDLLDEISVSVILAPDVTDDSRMRQRIEAAAEKTGTTFLPVQTAYQVTLGKGTLTVYPPPRTGNDNENCLSTVCSFGDFDLMTTGDLPSAMERELLAKYSFPKVEALLAGHHGSYTSTSRALLEAVQPKLVIVSVGKNTYGHPSAQVLSRIASVGAQVLRTDQEGDITIRR